MATTDPIEILLTHNRWATRNLLDACAALTDEQFHQPFEMGVGSLHDTITHILGAMAGWNDMLANREQRPRLEGERRSVAELTDLLDAVSDDFEAAARAHPLDEEVGGERGGRVYTFTRAGVITHVMTHGMHHRAQCLNMLRQMGVDALPPSAIVEWMFMVDTPFKMA